MKLLIRGLLALAACCGLAPGAEPAPLPGESLTTSLAVAKPALAAALRSTRPGSMVDDPEAAAVVDHIAAQLALLAESDDLDDNPLAILHHLLVNDGALFTLGHYGVPDFPARRLGPRVVITSDLGSRSPVSGPALLSTIDQVGEEVTIAGMTGQEVESGSLFAALDGDRFILGTTGLIAQHFRERPTLLQAPIASVSWQGSHLLSRLQTMAVYDDEVAMLLAAFPARWQQEAPQVLIRLAAPADLWQSAIDIAAQGLARLRQPAADFLHGFGQPMIDVCAGLDLAALHALWPPELWEEFAQEEGGQLAAIYEQLLGALDGDLRLQAEWQSGPLPSMRLELGLAEAARLRSLLDTWAHEMGLQESARLPAGASRAFSCNSPLGLIQLAADERRLVLSNGPLTSLAPAAGAPARWPADQVLGLHADLPALGRILLPMAYGLLADVDLPLAEEPLRPLRFIDWHLRVRLETQLAAPEGLSAVESLEAFLTADRNTGHIWALGQLQNSFPTVHDADGTWIDRYCTLVGPAKGGEPDEFFIVLRSERGFEYYRDEDQRTASAAELAAQGLQVRLGRSLDALAVLTLPSIPRFDHRWLPPLPVLLRHLPSYRFRLHQQATGLRAEETGLPLFSSLAGVGAFVLWGIEMEQLPRDFQRSIDYQARRALDQLHPEMADRLPLISSLITLRLEALPEAEGLAALIGDGLPLSAFAPLFDQRFPAAASDLDRIGRFTREGNEFLWEIAFGDVGWAVTVNQWGQVYYVADSDAPGIPADIDWQVVPAAADDERETLPRMPIDF